MDWFELSEKEVGLAWEGRRAWSAFDPSTFAPPYDAVVRIMQKKGASKEDVLKQVSEKYIQNAKHSVGHLNGLGEEKVIDDAFIKSFQAYQLAKRLSKVASALEKNEDIDLLPVHGQLTSLVSGQATGLAPAKNINYKNYKPFMKCGYAPIDNILGGIPSDGPIIAYGIQGVGKSHFSEILSLGQLTEYKDKNVGIYTLEMSAEHYLWRAVKMYKDLEKYLDRLFVSGSIRSVNDLVSEVQTKRLDFIVIDDMDRIAGGTNPEAYQQAYLRIADICRFLKIPVLILAQPNREAKLAIQRGERFLSPYDISWSSGAENAAALLIGLQRANALDMITKDSRGAPIDPMFPVEDDDREYLIFWKSRDGWPGDYSLKGQLGPGAIRLEKRSKNDKIWMGEPYGNRLWQPNYRPKKEVNRK